MKDDTSATPDLKRLRKSQSSTASLFSAGGYINVPNVYLTPEYVAQVGVEGIGLIAIFLKAYDNGVHYRGVRDGWMRIPDAKLADWLGLKSNAQVRRLRKRIMNAQPSFFDNSLEGT